MSEKTPKKEPTDAHTLARRVDEVCDEFERVWQDGARPRLEQFLDGWNSPERSQLLRELLAIECAYLSKSGQVWTPAEFEARFPADTDLVSEVLAAYGTEQERDIESDGTLSPAGEALGDRFGDYEIQEVLGWGGMGVVYKARQVSADRAVALKVIRSDRLSDLTSQQRSETVARFQREARAAAGLEHDHLVTVYDVGEVDGRPYYSMQLVHGQTLATVTRDGPLQDRLAAEYIKTTVQAVQAAHERGILHRDLKPQNMILDAQSNRVLVTDFGLAKLYDADVSATKTGDIFGSPPYMPPEQAKSSGSVTTAADIYGLGATLYQLITGRPPFQATTVVDTLKQVMEQEPVSPRILNPTVGRDLETICLKCLEKEPTRRYETARELADDLDRFLKYEPVAAQPIGRLERGWRWCRRHPAHAGMLAFACVALLAIVGVGVALAYQDQLHNANDKLATANSSLETVNGQLETTNAKLQRALGSAESAKSLAEKAHRAEARAREKLDQLLYIRRVNLALAEFQGGEVNKARQLLAECPPARRGWEWYYAYRLCHREILTIDAALHVRRVAFSPDGKRMACGIRDNSVRVSDTTTGATILTLKGHNRPVNNVIFSSDGKHVAGLSLTENRLIVWDSVSGRTTLTHITHPRSRIPISSWKSVQFSSNGEMIASSGPQNTVHVWETSTGRQLLQLRGHADRIYCVAFSRDGKQIATGSYDTTVKLWNATTGRLVHTLTGHMGRIYSVAFSGDGKQLASGSTDKTARVWNTATGKASVTLGEHRRAVTALRFNPDGTRVLCTAFSDTLWDVTTAQKLLTFSRRATFSPDGTRIIGRRNDEGKHLSIWSVSTAKIIATFPKLSSESVSFSPDGNRIASVHSGKAVSVADAATGKELLELKGHLNRISTVEFSPDGQRIVTGARRRGNTGIIKLWDAALHPRSLRGHDKPVHSVTFSPDGRSIATAGSDKTVKLWDATTLKNTHNLSGHLHRVDSVAFLPGTQLIASSSSGRDARIWNVRTGEIVKTFAGVSSHNVAISPDGKHFAGGWNGNAIKLWDAGTGNAILNFKGRHANVVWSVTFSPRGNRIVTASLDKTVKVWDTKTGKNLVTFRGHAQNVSCAVFSPNGKQIASGSWDGRVKIWDATSGQEVLDLAGHSGNVRSLAFSPDGLRVVSGGSDRALKLWDVATGLETLTLKGHTAGVWSVAFSPSGRRIASASSDGTVRLWDAPKQSE